MWKPHILLASSLKKRMILLLICCLFLPVIMIECIVFSQVFRLYHSNVDMAIRHELAQSADGIAQLMENMQSMSQQLASDGTIGRNLYHYFDRDGAQQKTEILQYLNDQILNYEIANPNIANITYFDLSYEDEPNRINQSSLARGGLPDETLVFSRQNLITYYGPHTTASVAAQYPVISLLRRFEMKNSDSEVMIYIESGFRKLEKLLPSTVQDMECVFVMISDQGRVVYSSDPQAVPLRETMTDLSEPYGRDSRRFVSFSSQRPGSWGIRLLIPRAAYYRHIYLLAVNFILIALAALVLILGVSCLLWRSLYRPFRQFERNLRQIVSEGDVQACVEKMNITEFDENFAFFAKLKKRILDLMQRVKEEEKERSLLEIKQLLGKMNPHFIHNTLDTLKWYADTKGYHDIVDFISAMNKLLMYNMEKDGRTTTLQRELAAVGDYIVLQNLKYELDFRVENHLPAPMLAARMPRFILQPIVENAIVHGSGTPRLIRVRAALLPSGKISISAANSGPPIDEQLASRILSSSGGDFGGGIGLAYIVRMLQEQFGDRFEFHTRRRKDGLNELEIVFPFEVF